jgi:hypothetical protein
MLGGISVGFQLNSELWGGCSSTASGAPLDIHISFGRQSNKRSGSTGLLKEQIIIEKLLIQFMKLQWEEPQDTRDTRGSHDQGLRVDMFATCTCMYPLAA